MAIEVKVLMVIKVDQNLIPREINFATARRIIIL
jgi:hypothetical protein